MPGKRHHVVSRFLLSRFASETTRGPRICRLEVRIGANKQIAPTDAEVGKHFYTVELGGARSLIGEQALWAVENAAAPRIAEIVTKGVEPSGAARLEIAMFIAAAKTRTPVARHIARSAAERAEAWRLADHVIDGAVARAEASGADLDREQLRREADQFISDLRSGDLSVEAPQTLLVALALNSAVYLAYVFTLFDWTVVRSHERGFVLPDAVVSVRDPTPRIPETGAAPLSSVNAETFIPIDPTTGLVLRPTTRVFEFLAKYDDALRTDLPTRILELIAGNEGSSTFLEIDAEDAANLNLLAYAFAHRYVYGTQAAVTLAHRDARQRRQRLAELRPRPPRLHILEDDPSRPGVLVETETIIADDPRQRV